MKIILTPEQQKRADTLAQMNPQEWDAVCKQCGICCLAKYPFCLDCSGYKETIFLKQCCEHFDLKTRKCTVFQSRLSVPHCEKVTMDVILEGKKLPASCGYVEYIFGPAPFPAKVDFNQVRHVPYDEEVSSEQLRQDMIRESILWTERRR